MNADRFEVVVIGGGPAGHKAAIQAAKAGRSVVLIDRQRLLGGECVHRGTIPSKTLHDAASRLVSLKRDTSRLFGLGTTGELQVDSLMGRLDSVRDSHAAFLDA